MFHYRLFIMHRLLKTKAHLGYKAPYSKIQPHIYGFRNEMTIFHLDKTVICLRRACNVIQKILESKGSLLFVNTRSEYNQIIQETAKRTNQCYINYKWIGGFLTNWKHMKHVQRHFVSIKKMLSFKEHSFANSKRIQPNYLNNAERPMMSGHLGDQKPGFQHMSLPRFKKMEKSFEGTQLMEELPDCLIVIGANQAFIAIHEAHKLQIPIISLVDSDINNKLLNFITYPVPVNVDSQSFVSIFCNCIIRSIYTGSKSKITPKKVVPSGLL